MCGITLFITKQENKENAVTNVINSLYQLQNRGYDSFGISYYDKNEKLYKVYKKSNYWNIGQEQDLFEYQSHSAKGIEASLTGVRPRTITSTSFFISFTNLFNPNLKASSES